MAWRSGGDGRYGILMEFLGLLQSVQPVLILRRSSEIIIPAISSGMVHGMGGFGLCGALGRMYSYCEGI